MIYIIVLFVLSIITWTGGTRVHLKNPNTKEKTFLLLLKVNVAAREFFVPELSFALPLAYPAQVRGHSFVCC